MDSDTPKQIDPPRPRPGNRAGEDRLSAEGADPAAPRRANAAKLRRVINGSANPWASPAYFGGPGDEAVFHREIDSRQGIATREFQQSLPSPF